MELGRLGTFLKVLIALYVLFTLLSTIADIVIETPAINELVFHSATFHLVLFVILAAIAWPITVYMEKRKS